MPRTVVLARGGAWSSIRSCRRPRTDWPAPCERRAGERSHTRVMIEHVWSYDPLPEDLGAVVHGPVLLARVDGVAVGLRCVFAHPTGLHLPVVLLANGHGADLANRASFPGRVSTPTFRLLAEANGKRGRVDPWRQGSEGGDGRFEMRADYWVNELPDDRTLALTVAWPEIGLPQTSTTLLLGKMTEGPYCMRSPCPPISQRARCRYPPATGTDRRASHTMSLIPKVGSTKCLPNVDTSARLSMSER